MQFYWTAHCADRIPVVLYKVEEGDALDGEEELEMISFRREVVVAFLSFL